jgi:hypothetical protein
MKIKLDENGTAVLQDGNPVYVQDDGSDMVVNPDQLFSKIKELNSESKTRRLEINSLKEKFGVFSGIENLEDWKQKADQAISLANDLDNSKLIKAGEVSDLKNKLRSEFEADKQNLISQFSEAKKEFDSNIKEKEDAIFNLMVGNKFATSDYFNGSPDSKTILPADIAMSYFSKHFSVEKDLKGNLRFVGKDHNGNNINGLDGEPASFEVAIKKIIDESPLKTQIMRAPGGSGSGSLGGSSDGSSGRDDFSRIKKKYEDAVSSGDTLSAINLKNQLYQLKREKDG